MKFGAFLWELDFRYPPAKYFHMLHKNVMQFSPVEHQEFGVIRFSIFGQALSKNRIGSKRPKIEKFNFLNIKKHCFWKNADILVCNQILRFLRYFLNGKTNFRITYFEIGLFQEKYSFCRFSRQIFIKKITFLF